MPPQWAIDRFTSAMLAYHQGNAVGIDQALEVPLNAGLARGWHERLRLWTAVVAGVTEYRTAHPRRGNTEESYEDAAKKPGVYIGFDAVKRLFLRYQGLYGDAKSMREMQEIAEANPEECSLGKPKGRPKGTPGHPRKARGRPKKTNR
jgi:hypothetical protein